MEITKELNLNEEQNTLIDMHSFMNVMNVLVTELYMLDMSIDNSDRIDDAIAMIISFSNIIRNPEEIVEKLKDAEGIKKDILDSVEKALEKTNITDDIRDSVGNIKSILDIFSVRTRELLLRFDKPDNWELHNIGQLKNNFMNVFQAIEKNSKGRYRIIYNIAQHDVRDYFVQFDISSQDAENIYMPPVFQDVMRDLIANARKYTQPGGKIIAGLYEDDNQLIFVVEDTGRGIPETQIESVVDFGFRADNVIDNETKGGGFGLTKAYWVTKKFNGRMFIDSVLNKGTTVKINIPKPN